MRRLLLLALVVAGCGPGALRIDPARISCGQTAAATITLATAYPPDTKLRRLLERIGPTRETVLDGQMTLAEPLFTRQPDGTWRTDEDVQLLCEEPGLGEYLLTVYEGSNEVGQIRFTISE